MNSLTGGGRESGLPDFAEESANHLTALTTTIAEKIRSPSMSQTNELPNIIKSEAETLSDLAYISLLLPGGTYQRFAEALRPLAVETSSVQYRDAYWSCASAWNRLKVRLTMTQAIGEGTREQDDAIAVLSSSVVSAGDDGLPDQHLVNFTPWGSKAVFGECL